MRKLLFLLCLIPQLAFAQEEEDKGFIVNWLQENLSGAGRVVTIDGFQGALSSRASLTQLTIADDEGIWLTLKDVTLDWSRAALLRGRVEVTALTAAEIDMARLPVTAGSTAPEARAFALPDLPVAIEIGKVEAQRIHLGPTVLGEDVVATLTADVSLADGAGDAHLDLTRQDAEGHVKLDVRYGNADQVLTVNLDAAEGPGGIAARRLNLPGAPATSLTVKGSGPLKDFTAQVNLSTDGATRLGGLVTLQDGSFSAALAGDPTPVFLSQYADFFGPSVALQVRGSTTGGGLVLDNLSLQAAALTLDGKARFAAGGRPELLDFTGTLGLKDQDVTLPLTTETPVTLGSGTLKVFHDETQGTGWQVEADLKDLSTGDFTAGALSLTADGDLAPSLFDGTVRLTVQGLQASDPALAKALGSVITAAARFRWEGGATTIEDLSLTAPGLALSTQGTLTGGSFQGKLSGHVDDLDRFSLYRPGVSGALRFDLDGQVQPISGAFDLTGTLAGTGMAVGQAQADAILKDQSQVEISVRRDETGITLRRLSGTAGALNADISGTITSAGNDLAGTLSMADLSALGYGGAISAEVKLTGRMEDGRLEAKAEGQDLSFGQADLDRLLRGTSSITAQARMSDGKIRVEGLTLSTDQLTGTASGPLEGLTVSARLANLGLFVPQYPGAVTMTGTAGWADGGVPLNLTVKGPGRIDAVVTGRIASGATALSAKGTGAAALANPFLGQRSVAGALSFDLSLDQMALAGLNGSVRLTGGSFADPDLTFALREMVASATIAGGRATIDAEAAVSTGGSVSARGTVGMTGAYPADLAIGVQSVSLRDPQLYETTISGDLTFQGPALGGATIAGNLRLGRTELRIPSTSGVPDMLQGLKHVGDSAAVRTTRARALKDQGGSGGSGGPGYGLNVQIAAPNQVFLRGRGLDAELGGSLTLRGTTNAISPQGAFTLLRGRMDILGRRLTLTEATLDLQGALVPFVHVEASTETEDITATVVVDGPATEPTVTFASSPALPQEEVLAQLLFGRGLENISAFQAAQLAGAVATLAGRGGEGILGNIRAKTGLDNLDLQTDGTGGGSLTAGKYLSENLYSEVTVDQEGKSEISLNLDVARHITLKAKVDTEGNSGAGIFLKKDY